MRAASVLCATVSLLLFASFALQGRGGDVGSGKEKLQPFKVGHRVEEFVFALPDVDGGKHTWEGEEMDEQLIALVFWSYRDMYLKTYDARLRKIIEDYRGKGVTFFVIDSNHDEFSWHLEDPFKTIKKVIEDREIPYPILVDKDNVVADRFGVLTANHCFVLDKKRYLRYAGGFDSDPKDELKEYRADWLRDALDAVLANKRPEMPITRPAGRKLKRAPVRAR